MTTNCVRRMAIASITPDHSNALIIGVIIARTDVRRFVNKSDGGERGVWGFTIRDSPTDTINVTWWGTLSGLSTTAGIFSIGDVVEITNARIKFVQPDDRFQIYKPATTSPFSLELNENSNSDMVPHSEDDTSLIRELMKIPTKQPSDVLRLSDLVASGKSLEGEFVNLLVLVLYVGPVRTVAVRSSNLNKICRDIVVLDETVTEYRITVWDEDIMHWADIWRPKHTVLFMADLKMEMNNFKKMVMPSIRSRTVITVDPDIRQAESLRTYGRSVPDKNYAVDDDPDNPDTDSVEAPVMSTEKVLETARNSDGGKFCAMIYCYVTKLDIDGSTPVYAFKCQNCGKEQYENSPCTSAECVSLNPPLVPSFSLRVDLADHRGSLTGCRLSGIRAATVLGCTEERYIDMTSEERTERKWRLLLRRCVAKVMVQPGRHGRRAALTLLSCAPADPAQVANHLPIH